MEIEMYKNKHVLVKDSTNNYVTVKYSCPVCNSANIGVRRCKQNQADGKCNTCGHKWRMMFREDDPQIEQEKIDFMAKYGFDYTAINTPNPSAPYEQQIPF